MSISYINIRPLTSQTEISNRYVDGYSSYNNLSNNNINSNIQSNHKLSLISNPVINLEYSYPN